MWSLFEVISVFEANVSYKEMATMLQRKGSFITLNSTGTISTSFNMISCNNGVAGNILTAVCSHQQLFTCTASC